MYIISISLKGEKGEFIALDGNPLEVKKDIILWKKEGKVKLILEIELYVSISNQK